MQKIVILRWQGRITTSSGSATPDAAARIVDYAANAADHPTGETETIWLAHGDLDVTPYEVTREDAEHLIGMLWEADKEAHAGAKEMTR